MTQEIAAAPFVALGEDDPLFLSGLRADVLSALATRPALKVYSASFNPTHDADFSGHVFQIAAARTRTHLHVLASLRTSGAPPRAGSLDIALAQVSSAARRIAELAMSLLEGRPLRSKSAHPDAVLSQSAYEHLLLGRHHANKVTPANNETALKHFRAVLAEAPDHAPALAGLAATTFQQIRYGALGASHYAFVRKTAEAAIHADPSHVHAHVVLGLVSMYHDRDFRAAADAFGDALALDRDHVDVVKEYAWLLSATNHDTEAIAAMDRALEYDPLSVDLLCTKASLYRYANDPASALALYRQAHSLDLRYARAIEGIASTASSLGHADDAYRYLDLYRRHAPNRFWRYRVMGMVAARLGNTDLLAEALRQLETYAKEHPETDLSADLLSVYAFVDADIAMRHFTDAYTNGVGLVSLLRYPAFDRLRHRDDYRQLVADLDLDVNVPELVGARTRVLHFGRGRPDALSLPKTAFLYAEAQRNYVTIHAQRGTRRTRHLVRTSLTALDEWLRDEGLLRVHHSFLVNVDMPGWRLDGNAHTARLRLDRLDAEVPVSRARYRTVLDALAA